MKIWISDVDSGHGLVFTLAMRSEPGNEEDRKVLDFLHGLHGMTKAALYTQGIRGETDSCELELWQSPKYLAQVDGHWNSRRKDKKYVVLIVEGENS